MALNEHVLVEAFPGVFPAELVSQGTVEVELTLSREDDACSVVLEPELVEGERTYKRRDGAVAVVPAGLLDESVHQQVQTLFDAADELQGVLADEVEGMFVDVVRAI